MPKYDFRILVEKESGHRESYHSESFVDTDANYVLTTSEAHDRILNMHSCSYHDSYHLPSDFTINSKGGVRQPFSDGNAWLSASIGDGGVNTGSIYIQPKTDAHNYATPANGGSGVQAHENGTDPVKRFKFFGTKVCTVMGFPENIWLYADTFRLSKTSNETNYFRGDIVASKLNVIDNLTLSNIATIGGDLNFAIVSASLTSSAEKFIKFSDFSELDTTGKPFHGLKIGLEQSGSKHQYLIGSEAINPQKKQGSRYVRVQGVNQIFVGSPSILSDPITDPQSHASLIVSGTISASGDLNIEGFGSVGAPDASLRTAESLNTFNVFNEATDGDDGIMIIRDDTSVTADQLLGGIGFDSHDGNIPSSVLQASAYIAGYAGTTTAASEKSGYLTFGLTEANTADDTTSTEVFRITGSVPIQSNIEPGLVVHGHISASRLRLDGSLVGVNFLGADVPVISFTRSGTGVTIGELHIGGSTNLYPTRIYGQGSGADLIISKSNFGFGSAFSTSTGVLPTKKISVDGDISGSGELIMEGNVTASNLNYTKAYGCDPVFFKENNGSAGPNWYKLGSIAGNGARLKVEVFGQHDYGYSESFLTEGVFSIGNADNEYGATQWTRGDYSSDHEVTFGYKDTGVYKRIDCYLKLEDYFIGSVTVKEGDGFTPTSNPGSRLSDPSWSNEATKKFIIPNNPVAIGTNQPATGSACTLTVSGSISSSGYHYKGANFPCFSAYLSSDNTSLSQDAWTTITFDTEDYDLSGDYDHTNGVFTAPVTGIYWFHGNITFVDHLDNVVAVGVRIKTTNQEYASLFDANQGGYEDGDEIEPHTFQTTAQVKLVAGETARCQYYQETTHGDMDSVCPYDDTSNRITYFQGKLETALDS